MADEIGTDTEHDGGTGGGTSPGAISAAIVAVFGAIFVAQNAHTTSVKFLVWEGEVSLFLVIVISMILGAVIGWFVGYVRRHRKRKRA